MDNASRLLGMLVVFGAIGALGISAVPNAFANTPSPSFSPSVPVVEGQAPTFKLTGAVDGTAPHLDVRVGFAEPPSTGLLTDDDPTVVILGLPPGGGDCGLEIYDVASTGGSYWTFNSGGSEAEFDIMASGDSVALLFAPGVINPIYTGTATGPASGSWVDQSGNAKAPSIDFETDLGVFPLEVYRLHFCGFDTGQGQNGLFQQQKILETQLSMAGEIIPIDATALVLGGITSPSMMMLPLLAIAAGGAFVYLRFEVLRKD